MDKKDNIKIGNLYIVATPIGNLKDITFRAIETLKEVDVIAAEDTRHTVKLLNHYQINTKLISHHEHNKKESIKGILMLLEQGKNIALVSDAGMPCVSDPGYELVYRIRKLGYSVTCLPGASALPSAIALSGLNTSRFRFEGFLPDKKTRRHELLEEIAKDGSAIVIYVAPHDLLKTIVDLQEYFENRKIAIVKDISKIHERVEIFNMSDVKQNVQHWNIKGEFVLVIEKGEMVKDDSWRRFSIVDHVNKVRIENNTDKMNAMKIVAKLRGVKKGDIYKEYIKMNNKKTP